MGTRHVEPLLSWECGPQASAHGENHSALLQGARAAQNLRGQASEFARGARGRLPKEATPRRDWL